MASRWRAALLARLPVGCQPHTAQFGCARRPAAASTSLQRLLWSRTGHSTAASGPLQRLLSRRAAEPAAANGVLHRWLLSRANIPAAPAAPQRRLLSSSANDFYALLGVERRASADEIKRAYYREAKRCHPDLNKSREAALRFRQIAEAYDVLRDPSKRRMYDLGVYRPASAGGAQQGGGGFEEGGVDPMNLFKTVWREFGLDDIEVYFGRVAQEGTAAFTAAFDGRRDFGPAKRFAIEHRGLIITTVLPLMLILRYPAAAFAAARGGLLVVLAVFRFMPANLRYRLIGDLWVSAIAYLQRVAEKAGSARPQSPPAGGGGAGFGSTSAKGGDASGGSSGSKPPPPPSGSGNADGKTPPRHTAGRGGSSGGYGYGPRVR